MKLKDLDLITKVHQKIKFLDEQISKLNAIAVKVVNNEANVILNLEVLDVLAKKEYDKKNIIDTDGDIRIGNSTSIFDLSLYSTNYLKVNKTPEYIYNIKEDLEETLLLDLLAVLISNKQEQRKKLLNKLKKFKIEL